MAFDSEEAKRGRPVAIQLHNNSQVVQEETTF